LGDLQNAREQQQQLQKLDPLAAQRLATIIGKHQK
jgi:hypothetical protein